MKKKQVASRALIIFLLVLVAFIMIMPFIWMVLGSVKMKSELFAVPLKWLPETPVWKNYTDVFEKVPFLQFYWNTAKVAVLATLGQVVTCALSAYAFSKLEFRGRDVLFMFYLATMMIPGQVTMVPQYELMNHLNLLNNHWTLILLRWFSPFGVFLLRQFFISIPDSLVEAARIDGAREVKIFTTVICPLAKPAFATLTTLTFLNAWNEFMGPLIFLNEKSKFTLQMGIRYFQQMFGTEYTLIMASTTMSLIPILLIYMLAQKYFIEGIAASGIKG
ncbi:carbohydrate ABC transporter permease [Cuneatibacter caecimuris]|uniref:Carbohydrate ABC transporter membrane protein 2 (CUT1 family) n=1 Tax=Cuneatibacter caecimuris TaxID=1796618 RepID=A0A4Q7P3S7_9FIRM|nr:carbohydrate ABC transporter permease [Cuneatibacter caecimuris]RZS94058.1 carbohydrate ABC transporter membrane protein 2 (CUT1 family) [Cuneatibacter caecimuris]